MTDETRAKLILQQLPSEINVYFAMIILSGCNALPRRKMYWENKPDFHCASMSDAMFWNCFDQIRSNIYLADNLKLDQDDRVTNVRRRQFAPNRDKKSVNEWLSNGSLL